MSFSIVLNRECDFTVGASLNDELYYYMSVWVIENQEMYYKYPGYKKGEYSKARIKNGILQFKHHDEHGWQDFPVREKHSIDFNNELIRKYLDMCFEISFLN